MFTLGRHLVTAMSCTLAEALVLFGWGRVPRIKLSFLSLGSWPRRSGKRIHDDPHGGCVVPPQSLGEGR
jgi:hypothetical protein